MVDQVDSICKQGLLRKVKTHKSKYFVLYQESASSPAKLEYYDNKKHWESKKKPKRIIYLKTCFSINAFSDSKTKFGMAMYTKDDSFQVGFETEEERDSWLSTVRALNRTHHDDRPMFQHVWNVKIRTKDLGKNYEGDYRLCLDERTIRLVKKACLDAAVIFPLEVIRRCGHTACFFNMEVGRQAVTGPGEFWMEVEDQLIAQNVHHAIVGNMNKKEDEDFRPKSSSVSKDKTSSSISSRHNTVSGAESRPRLRPGHSRSKLSHSPAGSLGQQLNERFRSNSMDTGTIGNLSVDEDDQPMSNSYGQSRSLTPDPRVEPPQGPLPYMDMSIGRHDGRKSLSSSLNSWSSAEASNDSSYHQDKQSASHRSSGSLASADVLSDFPKDSPYLAMSPHAHSDNYMPMAPLSNQRQEDGSYMDMKPGSSHSHMKDDSSVSMHTNSNQTSNSRSAVSPYMAMATPSSSPYVEMQPCGDSSNKNASYVEMSPKDMRVTNPYLSMSGGTSSKDVSTKRECGQKDDQCNVPQRHYSVGSRPHKKTNSEVDQYVEMNRERDMSDKDKSCSAPHLLPMSLASNPDLSHLLDVASMHTVVKPKPDVLTTLEFSRSKASGDVLSHRPRGSSWSQMTRPRSSSHGQKQKPLSTHSSKDSVHSNCSEYVDMIGKTDAYVEMTMSKEVSAHRKGSHGTLPQMKVSPPKLKTHNHQRKSASLDDYLDMRKTGGQSDLFDVNGKDEVKEVTAQSGRRPSQSQKFSDPFPELSGSEEDLSHTSSGSLNSQGLHSSSQISLAGSVDTPKHLSNSMPFYYSSLDNEPYVEVAPVSAVKSTGSGSAAKLSAKPQRVASFISDESLDQVSSSTCSLVVKPVVSSAQTPSIADTTPYMEMQPAPQLAVKMDLASVSPAVVSGPRPAPRQSEISQPESFQTQSRRSDSSHSDGSRSQAGGSSGESTMTLMDDPYSLMDLGQIQITPTASQAAHSSTAAPQKGISYIRQTSSDAILPTPMRPAPCYIRHSSVSSIVSEDLEMGASAAATSAVLDFLSCVDDLDNYSTVTLPSKAESKTSTVREEDPYMFMNNSSKPQQAEAPAPVNGNLKHGPKIIEPPSLYLLMNITPSGSPHPSSPPPAGPLPVDPPAEPAIPSTGKESWKMKPVAVRIARLPEADAPNARLLEQLEEETEELTISTAAPENVQCYIKEDKPRRNHPSLTKTGGASDSIQVPPEKGFCFIQDDVSKLDNVFADSPVRKERQKKPPPPLLPRSQSDEKAIKRLSYTDIAPDSSTLHYADLDPSTLQATAPTSPKPRLSNTGDENWAMNPSHYTTIDLHKTELLKQSKKK